MIQLDNVGIVVEDMDAAVAFFVELGLAVEGKAQVEGPWADQCVGLDGVRCDIVMMRTPDGHGRLELSQYLTPAAAPAVPQNAPHNIIGTHRVMYRVEDLDDMLARLRTHGAELVGEVAQYEDSIRICYVRALGGILVGLTEYLS
ncbi:VOC family protein [Kribbella sp. NBC_00709]|uniref:VOC family protein n=1 Tax=Kribbella sp. NBC_00709 TaxID=2975972 RepID=UPI002E2C3214|nr:VOC family protein [Kribbella sp. NBC_00709]